MRGFDFGVRDLRHHRVQRLRARQAGDDDRHLGDQFFHTVGNRDAGFRHLLAPLRIGIDACDDPPVGDQVAREGAAHDAKADNADPAFRSCRHLKPPVAFAFAFLAARVRYYMASGAGGRPAKVRGSCMRPRVYVTQPIAESALLRLKEIAEVEVNDDSSRIPVKDKLIDAAKRSDIILCLLHDTIDREVLAANPNLKAIASMTITPDRIDVTEATTRKIIVTNIPAVVTDATADIAFGLLLAVARRIVEGDRVVRSGVFPGSQSNHLAGAAVSGKTLGIVGMGRIGQAMARRARGFDMTVLYSDPRGLSAEEEQTLGLRSVELRGIARTVGLHLAASGS